MITATPYYQFRRVLAHEGLDDASAFIQADFFDEIPLYSRYAQIEPLIGPSESSDEVLLALAIEYLEEVASHVSPPNEVQTRPAHDLLLAITVWDGDDDYIVPNLFVCHGQVRERLQKLDLREPRSPFGRKIADLVRQLDSTRRLLVLEDTDTVPGDVREFIGYGASPGRIVGIGELKR